MNPVESVHLQTEDWLLQAGSAQAARTLREGRASDPQGLQQAARQFEGLFIRQILKQMQEATSQLEPEDEEKDSSAEHIQSMFWTFLGDAVTEQGGFGLWKSIYQQVASAAESEQKAEADGVDRRL